MSEPAPHDPFSALRHPKFRMFVAVRFLLSFALTMQFTALGWSVGRGAGGVLALGGLGLVEFLPLAVLALPVGAWVERREKRQVLTVGMAVLLAGGAVLWAIASQAIRERIGSGGFLVVAYAVVAVGGAIRSFFAPAFFTLIGSLTRSEHKANAAVWTSAAFWSAQVGGPVAAGLLMGFWSPAVAQGAAVACLAAALVLTTRLGHHPPVPSPVGESAADRLLGGLRFVWSNPIVRGALLLDLLAVLFGDAVPLLPVFVGEVLKADAQTFGLLRAMPGIGSIAMMVFFAFVPPRWITGWLLLAATASYGLSMVAFGLSRSVPLVATSLLACGLLDGVSVAVRQSVLQLRTPDNMRGRVGAVNAIFISSSNELGTFVSGAMARVLGLVPAILVGGGTILVVVAGLGASHPELRKMRLGEGGRSRG